MNYGLCIYLLYVLLLQGPASDRFGRRLTYMVSGAAFLATTVVCIFAPNIGMLVAFRALQGVAGEGWMGCSSSLLRALITEIVYHA
jgi:DHA1 family bicyclomycin/chloramphenicol resistance-like MFS transporter